jgi:hypothetical protein
MAMAERRSANETPPGSRRPAIELGREALVSPDFPIMTASYSEFADAERSWVFARADITNGIRLPSGGADKGR